MAGARRCGRPAAFPPARDGEFPTPAELPLMAAVVSLLRQQQDPRTAEHMTHGAAWSALHKATVAQAGLTTVGLAALRTFVNNLAPWTSTLKLEQEFPPGSPYHAFVNDLIAVERLRSEHFGEKQLRLQEKEDAKARAQARCDSFMQKRGGRGVAGASPPAGSGPPPAGSAPPPDDATGAPPLPPPPATRPRSASDHSDGDSPAWRRRRGDSALDGLLRAKTTLLMNGCAAGHKYVETMADGHIRVYCERCGHQP